MKNENLLKKLRNQRGVALIWTAVFLVAAFSMAALAIDFSFNYVVATELKSIGDAAALTASSVYLSEVRKQLEHGVDLSTISGDVIKIPVDHITEAMAQRSNILKLSGIKPHVSLAYGRYNFDGQPYRSGGGSQFQDLTRDLEAGSGINFGTITAFKATVQRGDADNNSANAIPRFFSKFLNVQSLIISKDSVSVLAPRNFILVLDTSGSMGYTTYPWYDPADHSRENPEPALRNFLELQSDGSIWYSPCAPGPRGVNRFTGIAACDAQFPMSTDNTGDGDSDDPEDAEAGQAYPQPLQTVLDSSLIFLNELASGGVVGDRAGIIYFSKYPATKLELTPIINANTSTGGTFDVLLKNRTLYDNLVKAAPDPSNPEDRPHYILNAAAADVYFAPMYNQYDKTVLDDLPVNGPIAIPYDNTNIGDAIKEAHNVITNDILGTGSGGGISQGISTIILFTDGVPDCISDGTTVTCNDAAAFKAQARDYTYQAARDTIADGIAVYPITYGTLDNDNNVLFDSIAGLSGLAHHFNIPTPPATWTEAQKRAVILDRLKQYLNEISKLSPFVLVA